jgi:hypothetical protein
MQNMSVLKGSLPLVLIMSLVSCCTPRKAESPPQAPARETPATALKQNLSAVEAVIDSVALGPAPGEYSLRVTLTRTTGVEPMENLAEAGQKITLVPQYVLGSTGAPDTASVRNKGLMGLRSATKGETLKGRIALGSDGRWVLVEVNSR